MRSDTFKLWLEEKGCRFDSHEHVRGNGHASLVVKLGDKRAVLQLIGTHQDMDGEDVSKILTDLGLDSQGIPTHVEGGKDQPY